MLIRLVAPSGIHLRAVELVGRICIWLHSTALRQNVLKAFGWVGAGHEDTRERRAQK